MSKAIRNKTAADLYAQGYNDAENLSDEDNFGGTAPGGGWDSWAIGAIGSEEFYGFDSDAEPDHEWRESLLAKAYCLGAEAFCEEWRADRQRKLLKADKEGFRICQFGLPGAGVWEVAVARSVEEANEISERLFQPGPYGPHDSAIMLPSQCDGARWGDGRSIYGDFVAEILSEIA